MSKNQDYDKIIRESVERVIPTIIEKLCGLRPSELLDLPTSFQRTRERRPDFLKKAVEQQQEYIIQIEFQTNTDRKMVTRMLDHYSMLLNHYGLMVRQFVIFIGNGKPNMPMEIQHPELQFRYRIVNLRHIDCDVFIHSQKPEEIILGVLADFKGQNSLSVIQSILHNLRKTVRSSRSLRKYCTQLEILSKLRNLQPQTIQQIEAMPITYDITTDIRYQQGIEQGIEQGMSLKTRKTVEKMLAGNRFSLREIADISDVSIDYVIKVQNELTDKDQKGKK
ncbi:MAG: hypothetical protein KA138_05850 [Saprospiraceae bacterium]|nr:hypothetical protein [Saprospiraceae bacterium]